MEGLLESLNNEKLKNSESSKVAKIGEAKKARMSEILDGLSDDDHDGCRNSSGGGKKTKPPTSMYSGSTISINIIDEFGSKIDHRPRDLFIQLNELQGTKGFQEWRETARWIKYEENVEEGADRWGRPHVSSLSFHSLLSVRRCLENGVVMMDSEEQDLGHIIHRAVETVSNFK